MHKLSPVCYLYTHFKQSIFETSLLIQLLQDCQYIKSAQQSLHGVIERLIFFFFFFFWGGGGGRAKQSRADPNNAASDQDLQCLLTEGSIETE